MPTIPPAALTFDQVRAFRLAGHGLVAPPPPGSLLPAACACALQNTPPGSAALALHARVAGLTLAEVDRVLYVDKTLLQLWSLRAAPHLVPAADAAVYSAGLLPEDEESLRYFVHGVEPALAQIGIGAVAVLALAGAALDELLDGAAMTKDELGRALAAAMDPVLSATQQAAWRSPSLYAAGQTLGESVARFALPLLALQGRCCHGARHGNRAELVRPDRWLGAPPAQMEPDAARAELARRYLRAYGPTTPGDMAAWAGISPKQAARTWALVRGELAAVTWRGGERWLLAADLPRLAAPLAAEGVRLLPPHDPYLQDPDRETLAPDRASQRILWRISGNPGAVLAAGRIVAAWRPQTRGPRLKLAVHWLVPAEPALAAVIEVAAEAMAAFRGLSLGGVEFAAGP